MQKLKLRNIFFKILLVVFILNCLPVKAQQINIPFFTTGDRVCFVGNSITHNGEFHHNILQYYVTRFPDTRIKFFNAGIKGDVTGGLLKRLDTDVMIYKPTHIVIMIGMNDVQRSLYGNAITTNADTLAKQNEALLLYDKNLNRIVDFFMQKKVKVILQKPSAYDQTTTIAYPNNFGVNDALIKCGFIMQKIADKYKLKTIDYNSIMTSITKQIQQQNPKATLTVNDRVHPNATGHFIMSYQFLKNTNATPIVAKFSIDVKKLNNKNNNKNCTVNNISYQKNILTFKVLEKALPFPVEEKHKQALDLVPFIESLNNETLQIQNVEKGNYQLWIDSTLIDNFSNDQLTKGINLGAYNKTPQYIQAKKVKQALEKLWDNEATLRAIAFVNYMFLDSFAQKNNAAATKKYLDSIYKFRFKGQAYYSNAFEKYNTYHNQINTILLQADSLRNIVYQLAKPTVHSFSIKKVEEPTVEALIEASQSGALPLLFNVMPKYLLPKIDTFNSDKEFFKRKGLPNFFKKINQQNAKLTIGFLGGSITKAEDQYRNQTLTFIQTLNPNAKITGVNAGVSGTGTELGACRVAEQILKYNPDLVFVEFAVNGGSNEAMEGIVRQILKHNPQTDICFIYTISGDQYKLYPSDKVPIKIQGFEKVATHYQIPSIHMGLYASILASQEKLIWKSTLDIANKIVFSKDGTHPTKQGGDLYAQAIVRAFNVFKKNAFATPIILPNPLYDESWEDATMYSPSAIASFSTNWESIKPIEQPNLKNYAPWFETVLKTATPDAYVTFKFTGTAFGFFDIGGPESGQILIEIDGKCDTLTRKAGNVANKIPNTTTIKCIKNRFSNYCNNRYRGQFELFVVSDGVHEVKIILSGIKADKKAILEGQELTDIEQNPAKYDQTVFYLGKILIKGKIVQ
jgi:lysophospholipase L1-like esterase